uniref:(California timema) hypothetical protein n=1 Tax=Timema californicum TaxID=61474 RepID=A0A7R9IZ44_TIMCA|nr:unnamed protein product [Timema californicum]
MRKLSSENVTDVRRGQKGHPSVPSCYTSGLMTTLQLLCFMHSASMQFKELGFSNKFLVPRIVNTVNENKMEFIQFFENIGENPDSWDTDAFVTAKRYGDDDTNVPNHYARDHLCGRSSVYVCVVGSSIANNLVLWQSMTTLLSFCLYPEPETTFVADHPFIFVLLDRPTKAILFYGKVDFSTSSSFSHSASSLLPKVQVACDAPSLSFAHLSLSYINYTVNSSLFTVAHIRISPVKSSHVQSCKVKTSPVAVAPYLNTNNPYLFTIAIQNELPFAMSFIMDTPEFVANHPFLFWLRDKSMNATLFLGRYIEPQ